MSAQGGDHKDLASFIDDAMGFLSAMGSEELDDAELYDTSLYDETSFDLKYAKSANQSYQDNCYAEHSSDIQQQITPMDEWDNALNQLVSDESGTDADAMDNEIDDVLSQSNAVLASLATEANEPINSSEQSIQGMPDVSAFVAESQTSVNETKNSSSSVGDGQAVKIHEGSTDEESHDRLQNQYIEWFQKAKSHAVESKQAGFQLDAKAYLHEAKLLRSEMEAIKQGCDANIIFSRTEQRHDVNKSRMEKFLPFLRSLRQALTETLDTAKLAIRWRDKASAQALLDVKNELKRKIREMEQAQCRLFQLPPAQQSHHTRTFKIQKHIAPNSDIQPHEMRIEVLGGFGIGNRLNGSEHGRNTCALGNRAVLANGDFELPAIPYTLYSTSQEKCDVGITQARDQCSEILKCFGVNPSIISNIQREQDKVEFEFDIHSIFNTGEDVVTVGPLTTDESNTASCSDYQPLTGTKQFTCITFNTSTRKVRTANGVHEVHTPTKSSINATKTKVLLIEMFAKIKKRRLLTTSYERILVAKSAIEASGALTDSSILLLVPMWNPSARTPSRVAVAAKNSIIHSKNNDQLGNIDASLVPKLEFPYGALLVRIGVRSPLIPQAPEVNEVSIDLPHFSSFPALELPSISTDASSNETTSKVNHENNNTASASATDVSAEQLKHALKKPMDAKIIHSYFALSHYVDEINKLLADDNMATDMSKQLLLLGRKGQYESKMTGIEEARDSGSLTPEGYQQAIESALALDIKLVRVLLQQERKKEAAEVMTRVRIMRKELAALTGAEEETS